MLPAVQKGVVYQRVEELDHRLAELGAQSFSPGFIPFARPSYVTLRLGRTTTRQLMTASEGGASFHPEARKTRDRRWAASRTLSDASRSKCAWTASAGLM